MYSLLKQFKCWYLCGFPRSCLPDQHKALVLHEDVGEALSVLPHRQLQALLQDLVVARRVGQVGVGVGLLLEGGLFREARTARRSHAAGHAG